MARNPIFLSGFGYFMLRKRSAGAPRCPAASNSARRPLLLGLVALAAAPRRRALAQDDADWAVVFIRKVGNEIAAIATADGSLRARKLQLAALIDRVVDVHSAARFCLGLYWRQATPLQQQEYVALFHAVLMRAVLTRISSEQPKSAGVQVQVERPEQRQDSVYVPTIIQRRGSPPFKVTWIVDTDAANPRILDVMAEGTSLRITIRADYAAFLHQHGGSIDALLQALRTQSCDDCAAATSGSVAGR